MNNQKLSESEIAIQVGNNDILDDIAESGDMYPPVPLYLTWRARYIHQFRKFTLMIDFCLIFLVGCS